MLDQASLPWFADLNRGLRDVLDDDAFEARIRANAAQLEALAAEIEALASADASAAAPATASLLFGMAA